MSLISFEYFYNLWTMVLFFEELFADDQLEFDTANFE